MRVSIHQPDFLPWLGFFNKIANSELFIVFDHVQAPRGKSWLTRNRIPLNGTSYWLTIPTRHKGLEPIYDVTIDRSQKYKRKHLGTIEQIYRKSLFFEQVFPIVSEIYESDESNLSNFNQNAIKKICQNLGLKIEYRLSSEIVREIPEIKELKGNDLILELCRVVGGTEYISGTGCLDFIDPNAFKQARIKFLFQNFKYQGYERVHEGLFIPYMSIIDSLFNIGFEKTANYIKNEMVIEPEYVLAKYKTV